MFTFDNCQDAVKLFETWKSLKGSENPLESRTSDRWSEIGFQGKVFFIYSLDLFATNWLVLNRKRSKHWLSWYGNAGSHKFAVWKHFNLLLSICEAYFKSFSSLKVTSRPPLTKLHRKSTQKACIQCMVTRLLLLELI